jgi:hypothetical protein
MLIKKCLMGLQLFKTKTVEANMLNKQKLHYQALFLPGRNPSPEFSEYYESAYRLWHSGWNEAYKKLGVEALKHSDNFTRQDEVGAIFAEKTCIGLVLYRWADAASESFDRDSYFKVWAPGDIEALRRFGDNILIPSYLTVHPEWRRLPGSEVQTTRLLMDFMVRRFLDSPADSMCSTTRNNRKINDIAYELGARPIRTGVAHFSEEDPVDLVVTTRDSARKCETLPHYAVAEKVWNNRQYVPATSPILGAAPERKGLSKAS